MSNNEQRIAVSIPPNMPKAPGSANDPVDLIKKMNSVSNQINADRQYDLPATREGFNFMVSDYFNDQRRWRNIFVGILFLGIPLLLFMFLTTRPVKNSTGNIYIKFIIIIAIFAVLYHIFSQLTFYLV